jgi:hypothetical protein
MDRHEPGTRKNRLGLGLGLGLDTVVNDGAC